jgi:hypothetical protein
MSSIKVEHIGISPEDYNRRNYVTEGQLDEGRQLRQKDRGLPALMPVSRPQKVDSNTNPRKANEANAKAIADANTKDLKNRGLTK